MRDGKTTLSDSHHAYVNSNFTGRNSYKNIMTLLDLAKRYPSMRRILARNRRRDLRKEWGM